MLADVRGRGTQRSESSAHSSLKRRSSQLKQSAVTALGESVHRGIAAVCGIGMPRRLRHRRHRIMDDGLRWDRVFGSAMWALGVWMPRSSSAELAFDVPLCTSVGRSVLFSTFQLSPSRSGLGVDSGVATSPKKNPRR